MRLVILAILLPLPAAAFTAQNGMTAVQTGPSGIAVIHEAKRADTDYWCGGRFCAACPGAAGRHKALARFPQAAAGRRRDRLHAGSWAGGR